MVLIYKGNKRIAQSFSILAVISGTWRRTHSGCEPLIQVLGTEPAPLGEQQVILPAELPLQLPRVRI